MLVTILADASYCPETGAAGYGFWIVCERGKHGGGDEMREVAPDNNVAEMQAVANAMLIAKQKGLLHALDTVLIQTDCMGAIDAFEGRRKYKSLSYREKAVVRWVNNFREELSLQVIYRHVKGHTGKKESRFVANKMCDLRAKRFMRQMRDRILQGNKNEDIPSVSLQPTA